MEFIKTDITGVWIMEPRRHADARGYFCETFRRDLFESHIGKVDFVQENESMSVRGVVRGLHFQAPPFTQAKLVRVSEGRVLDVAVDLRPGSATFGRHIAVELSGESGRQLYVPRGFAHGFAVLSERARFQYKVDEYYHPEAEGAIRCVDPDLGIDWRIPAGEMILSPKDLSAKTYAEYLKAPLQF